ncbi:MAG: hypothetical protein Q27BB25_04790 [Blastomonas sp. CACIA14H2]|uniref:DUF2141 domain-containing protein n=1 Tax=Blastomonas sp. CACIA14H2 TaxID=1419876 RepID=UPI0003CFEA7B|nr:MAG: hypothetical protein Q27BB25_04790 [Blastomonas sp. CACIA14H2]
MKTLYLAATLALATAGNGIAWASAPAAAPSSQAELTVTFEQIEIPEGQILLSLYDNEAAHDANGKPVRGAMAKVEGQAVSVRFEGLAPGRYAIKAFHDVDGDGKMKTNPFGMPLEPFAFSNNARPEGGPARWKGASFDVPAGASETRIAIQ